MMNKEIDALNSILSITPMIILLGFIAAAATGGILKSPGKLKGTAEEEHEAFMTSVWKIYGRKQPQRVRG